MKRISFVSLIKILFLFNDFSDCNWLSQRHLLFRGPVVLLEEDHTPSKILRQTIPSNFLLKTRVFNNVGEIAGNHFFGQIKVNGKSRPKDSFSIWSGKS